MSDDDELVERVARAIWNRRRESAAGMGIDLEEWGDGGIPRANDVFEEACAAIDVVRAYGEELMERHGITVGLPDGTKPL